MDPIYRMTYLQAVVIGLIQGITELFPISSLGHTVLIPSWLGGNWAVLVRQESRAESPYLAFVVGLHLATAIVLLAVYARTWVRVVRGFVTSITRREVRSPDQKLAWLIVVATIPVGLAGLVLEHPFRVLFAKPLAAAIFLMINGAILLTGKIIRRRAPQPGPARRGGPGAATARPEEAPPGGRGAVLDEGARGRAGRGRHPERPVDRGIPDPGPVRRDQPRGRDHGRRPAARAGPRGRHAVLVPALHPGHPGRGRFEAQRPDRLARRRCPGPDPGRQRGGRGHLAVRGALPGPLVPDPDSGPVRRLLPAGRPGQRDPVRLLRLAGGRRDHPGRAAAVHGPALAVDRDLSRWLLTGDAGPFGPAQRGRAGDGDLGRAAGDGQRDPGLAPVLVHGGGSAVAAPHLQGQRGRLVGGPDRPAGVDRQQRAVPDEQRRLLRRPGQAHPLGALVPGPGRVVEPGPGGQVDVLLAVGRGGRGDQQVSADQVLAGGGPGGPGHGG